MEVEQLMSDAVSSPCKFPNEGSRLAGVQGLPRRRFIEFSTEPSTSPGLKWSEQSARFSLVQKLLETQLRSL